ncbi:MAG: DNA polymerase III subunit gamma/tau [Bacteroidota bacterium]
MDQQYLVSARKYRPAAFASVVGQAHVTETLEHEVVSGRLAQALLFTGPRGVGKTTCARILARRINEVHTGEGLDYSLNIFELDAASNNTVDDIRQLIDQVRFAPQLGTYKVYIIDEVHMLSQAAFNAFLKTLEEPPAHAVFILATTEKHKVLPTILSRCQIFDFKRIGIGDIAEHLAWVAQQEGLTADPQALHAIAEKADGSLRDSLSIFDRIAAFAQGGTLTYELVRQNLQLVDRNLFVQLWESIEAGDRAAVLTAVHNVLDQGFDLQRFLMGFAGYVRELLLAHHPSTVALLDAPDSVKRGILDSASRVSAGRAATALKRLVAADAGYRAARNARWHVEVALLDLISDESVDEKKNPTSERLAEFEAPAKRPQPSSPAPAAEAVPAPAPMPAPEEPAASLLQESEPIGPDPVEPAASLLQESEPIELAPVLDEPVEVPLAPSSETVPVGSPVARVRRTAFSLKDLEPPSPTPIAVGAPLEQLGQEPDVLVAEVSTLVERRLRPVTQAALETAWLESAETLDEVPVIKAIVQQVKPVLEEDNGIRVSLENDLQEGYLNSVRDRILPFLRQALHNDSLKIRTEVQAGAVNARLVYTPDERYAFLLEKNPYLDEFRREFQLDIE